MAIYRIFSGVYVFVHLKVCFLTWHLKHDADIITKLDIDMFHLESWKLIYFGVQKSRSRVTKNSANVGFCTLASAGYVCFL